ncbi:hypothetical protein HYE15_02800 [Mycoplasmopsis bovis]|nr:hypothetical protein [Mycoplasmopsis bovis]QQH25609.1 hypothetical protein HYE15_02800 [Mycoplasmopsis bovis]
MNKNMEKFNEIIIFIGTKKDIQIAEAALFLFYNFNKFIIYLKATKVN